MTPIADITSAVKVLNERKWRTRCDWHIGKDWRGMTGVMITNLGSEIPTDWLRDVNAIAIANSLIAEERIAELEAHLAATCQWELNADGFYDTACGQAFQMENDEGLEANCFRFCYHCGKTITTYTAIDSQSQSQRS